MNKKRIAIFISGRGSNMVSLIQAAQDETYPAEIVLIVSDQKEAEGLQKAETYNIPTKTVLKADFPQKQDYDNALQKAIEPYNVDFICLAGFMRLLSKKFCDMWNGKMINIHPSLLPAYPGLHTYARALQDGVKFSGCTVHYVTAGMDEGPIIAQAALQVKAEDTEKTLAERTLEIEHRLYPQVLKKLCEKSSRDPSFFAEAA